MTVLYIDTSSSYLYSAIAKDNNLIGSVKEEYGQNLSTMALPSIVELFEKNNLSPKDVDKIIVVNGPGSFTGIRIGITIAKVYAWTLNIPITTIYSLEAMAISNKQSKNKIPILNARRGYVYAAIFDKENNIILKPQHIEFDRLMSEVNKLDDYVFISNDEFEDNINKEAYSPDFVGIINKFKDKENIEPHAVNPEYLKLTEAEEKL